MASNIKYTMYSIHVTYEQKYQIKCKTVMTWPWETVALLHSGLCWTIHKMFLPPGNQLDICITE